MTGAHVVQRAAAIGRVLMCLAGIGTVSACGSHDDAARAPSAASEVSVVPAGMLTTSEARSAMKGVYASGGSQPEWCCWIAQNATFYVDAREGAKSLRISLFAPTVKAYGSSPQTLSVLNDQGQLIGTHRLKTGEQSFNLPLRPNALGAGPSRLALHMAHAFVPAKLGEGGDVRELSVVLHEVAVR